MQDVVTSNDEELLDSLKKGHEQTSEQLGQLLDLNLKKKKETVNRDYLRLTNVGKFFCKEEVLIVEEYLACEVKTLEEYEKSKQMWLDAMLVLTSKSNDRWDKLNTLVSEESMFNKMEQMIMILREMYDGLFLDLTYSSLTEYERDDVKDLISLLPAGLKGLNLNMNKLGQMPPDFVKKLLTLLPDSLFTLKLGKNDFIGRSLDLFIDFVRHIPENIKNLELSREKLGQRYGAAGVSDIIKELPRGLLYLDLRHNQLGNCEMIHSYNIFKGLPEGLRELNLSINNLTNLSVWDMKQMIRWLPKGLKILNLAGNSIGIDENSRNKKDSHIFQNLFSQLPEGLEYLDLSENGFEEYSKEFLGISENVNVVL